jgi:hypothetical protein
MAAGRRPFLFGRPAEKKSFSETPYMEYNELLGNIGSGYAAYGEKGAGRTGASNREVME